MSDDGMNVRPPVAPLMGSSQLEPPARPRSQQVAVPAAQPEAKPKPAVADIEAVARQLESFLKRVSRSLEFHVDGASGRTVCSVRDAETGDLIRQIPNEEVLRLAELAHDETIVLVNERV
jgi:flagellar protein FlaG